MASDADHETVLEGGVDAAYLAYVQSRFLISGCCRWARSATCQSLRPTMSRAAVCPFIRRSLAAHDVILRSGRHYPKTEHLERGLERSPLVFRRVAWEGDPLTGREAALAGEGVAIDLSLSLVSDALAAGSSCRACGLASPFWRPSVVFRTDHPQLERLERFARCFHDEERRAVDERQKVVEKLLDGLRKACV